MKQTFKFIAIIVLSAAVAFVIAYIIAGDSLGRFGVIGIGLAMLIASVMGAFDVAEKKKDGKKFDSIRHYDGRKSYGQAAVFIGTACLFIGSPDKCDEVADDLWHWGQQAEVRALTGDETFNIL